MTWYEWLVLGVVVGAGAVAGFALWQLSKIDLWR